MTSFESRCSFEFGPGADNSGNPGKHKSLPASRFRVVLHRHNGCKFNKGRGPSVISRRETRLSVERSPPATDRRHSCPAVRARRSGPSQRRGAAGSYRGYKCFLTLGAVPELGVFWVIHGENSYSPSPLICVFSGYRCFLVEFWPSAPFLNFPLDLQLQCAPLGLGSS